MYLPEAVRLEALVSLAGISRLIALQRREAFFLREVVGTVMTMIGQRRLADNQAEETLDSATHDAPDGLSPDQLAAVSQALSHGKIAIRRKESSEGNNALLNIVERVCDVFGLHAGDSSPSGVAAYGWPELQVEVVKEAVQMTELLPGG
jgi:hypothetical protein